jgi:hypothetical protein
MGNKSNKTLRVPTINIKMLLLPLINSKIYLVKFNVCTEKMNKDRFPDLIINHWRGFSSYSPRMNFIDL